MKLPVPIPLDPETLLPVRLDGETMQGYEALCQYCQMPPERRSRQAVQHMRGYRSRTTIDRWADSAYWSARADASDAARLQRRQAEWHERERAVALEMLEAERKAQLDGRRLLLDAIPRLREVIERPEVDGRELAQVTRELIKIAGHAPPRIEAPPRAEGASDPTAAKVDAVEALHAAGIPRELLAPIAAWLLQQAEDQR